MSSEALRTPESVRDLDPNVLQRRASAPETSVWVSASAGTGKTKVLTDRVLRLLLPHEDGQPGCAAHKILCLTFTKAGAGEMALRISKTLADWAVLPLEGEQGLREKLHRLLGRPAREDELSAARRLFADVVDVPGGLKIMTIHAFCQSVLGRFPLEAGTDPHFAVLEDAQAARLMERARAGVFTAAQESKAHPLAAALEHIAAEVNEEQFQALLGLIARERSQLETLLKRHFDLDGLYTEICAHYGIQAGQDAEDIFYQACEDSAFEKEPLKNAARLMMDIGGKTDQDAGAKILDWLALDSAKRRANFALYMSAFLTGKNEIRARLATKKVCEAGPDVPDILAREAQRLLALRETANAVQSAALTRDVLQLGRAVLEDYETFKAQQGALDFDDLILQTLSLLRQDDMAGWVHYKLDQGLDHILVDEAQDTNPEQWQIIEALCDDFFHGAAAHETPRTVFVVGDEKQSIYSFQRAAPEEFSRMQRDFKARIEAARQRWDSVPMNISFRSVKSVLDAVDAVFSAEEARKGLGDLPVEHSAFRRGQAGLVELWPVFESDEAREADLWTPLKDPEAQQSGAKKLAVHIAQTIKSWLSSGEVLPSYGRAVRPGDIMILVRTRGSLVSQIARELKNLDIPVSGLDRMVLSEELAVQDLCAAGEFTLQPLDDLTLACLLKSPLIGLNEDALYELAVGREGESLWARVRVNAPDVAAYLESLQHFAAAHGPFAFFSHILQTPCPGDAISGRRAFMGRLGADSLDPVDEFLNLARHFEQNETASLQLFLAAQKTQSPEIKREQHGDADEVRILTVHGSKGLQAPIVILPDTVASAASAPNRADKRLLWPNQTGLDVALWSPRKDMDCEAYSAAMAALDEKLDEEYRRLLYVAMTRAEDRLYVCGALNRKQRTDNLPEMCWYSLVQNGLRRAGAQEDEGVLRLSNPQTKDPDRSDKPNAKGQVPADLPGWMRQDPAPEPEAHGIFRPSHALEVSTSPLRNAGTQRFLRGNLTHKLLQLLPEITPDKREIAARAFLERYGTAFDEAVRREIVSETLAILGHPDYAALFGPDSRAEVPVTGYLEGKGLVSGQVDRLCVTADEILIIDYKTNRPPPQESANIPQIYKEQMRSYGAVLGEIYPGRRIRASLLWTDGPILMPLDLESI